MHTEMHFIQIKKWKTGFGGEASVIALFSDINSARRQGL